MKEAKLLPPPPPPPTPLQHISCSHSPKPRSLLCQQYFQQLWWSRTGSICLQSSSTEREQRISLDRLTVHIYNKNTLLVPRPHYSARPKRFGSCGLIVVRRFPTVRLGYVTEMNWPKGTGKTPYRDWAKKTPWFLSSYLFSSLFHLKLKTRDVLFVSFDSGLFPNFYSREHRQ